MLHSFFYFLVAMLFIAGVVFFLWRTERIPVKRLKYLSKEDGALPEPTTLHPGIDEKKCMGCGICIEACPEDGVLGMRDKKAYVADYRRCLGHGACYQTCPFDAITLRFGIERRGDDLPLIYENYESLTPNIFIAGELGGMGILRNAAEQAIEAVDNIVRSMSDVPGADYDLVIVGAGTAGLSAALEAKKNNLRFIVLEQETIERSIANHPRKKVSGTVKLDLPLAGQLSLKNTTKRQLTEIWHNIVLIYRLPVQENCMVKSIDRHNGCFSLVSSDGQVFTTNFVLLAIGRRGSPEKLNIPGESLDKVAYRIPDPDYVSGREILIAGCGNSAVESAMILSEKNQVTIICPDEVLEKLTPLNRKSVEKAVSKGKIRIYFKTRLLGIEEKSVMLSSGKGIMKLKNDLVYIFAGGVSTMEFLKSIGAGASLPYREELLYHS